MERLSGTSNRGRFSMEHEILMLQYLKDAFHCHLKMLVAASVSSGWGLGGGLYWVTVELHPEVLDPDYLGLW